MTREAADKYVANMPKIQHFGESWPRDNSLLESTGTDYGHCVRRGYH